ncbi:glutathione peroxidase [Synechococcus sp. PCC 7502]|uniref:glutathione peroxidase n=1 Tax=Synechococcus sp. PCC 7502 TaxID=1173263 RepID=UPI00029F9C79|nr:glutathione peroxidase [Synechococcus sp. PCC 7502]AFY74406.1 glutathione peroxidase [Synechococcus sp. PCC 7502]
MTTLYDFSVKNIDGKDTKLSDYQGKVALIVNVASKCGYTPQYKGLENLYKAYKDQGFVILGFPSNDFGAQEPGTEEQIKQFCSLTYDVSFDLFSKVKVKGKEKVDVYKYLTEATKAEVQWNFNKFLVDKSGNVVKYYASGVSPDSPELKKDIEALLS